MLHSTFARLGFLSALLFSLHAPVAAFALTSDEAGCRDTIAGSMTGYAKSVAKMTASCHKRRSMGSTPLTVDCNDPDAADSRGRLPQLRTDIRTEIIIACHGSEDLLDNYPTCPAPAAASDDGGDTTAIDDFAEVADCLLDLSDAGISANSAAAMGDPDVVLSSGASKCQGTLGKTTSTLMGAIMRERRKCQSRADGAGDGSYSCEGADPSGKIAKARATLRKKVEKACDVPPAELATLNACGDTAAELRDCSEASADSQGSALIRNAYVLTDSSGTTTTTTTTTSTTTTTTSTTTTTTSTTTTTTTTLPGTACGSTAPTCNGSCPNGTTCSTDGDGCTCTAVATGACAPATIRRIINAKYSAVPSTATALSAGWSGSAHDVDIPNQTGDVIDVTCDENCENCDVSLNVQEDIPTSNCRCTGNPQTTCSVINGPDADSCGSLDPTCRCYFGSPLAMSAGGTPVCVVNRIRQDYAGTMNLRTGEWHDQIRLASVVHLGLSSVNPCPTCDGDPVANDGVRGGTCNGGLTSGSCDVNGDHLTFGPTSFDCLPSAATNISGGGLLLELNATTGTDSLSADLPCETPLGADCPCRVCSGNSSIGCSSDAQCAAAGAGACTAAGGAGVQPNQCEGFTCDATGRCDSGPVDQYCDAVTHPDGRGFIPCSADADCAASGGGACTILDTRRCFTDPIVVTGDADIYNPVSSAVFCIPPTTNPAVNLSGGLPGPGTFTLDYNTDIRCQNNPSVVYEFPSGANCEGMGTTTTTLLPLPQCEDADSPICGGLCPLGQTCGDNAGVCECTGLPLPSCDDATAPLCGGICPVTGEICQDNGGVCECNVPTLPQCAGALSPVCGGQCPLGELCLDNAGTCECQAPGIPACGTAAAPVCAGLCDPGQVCVANGDSCGCTNVLPPCGEALSPICAGSCPLGALCTDNAGACQCMLLPLP